MDAPIIESGMSFGPYPAGHCFYIERSEIYRRIRSGVKMAEFLLLRTPDGKAPIVYIVEAKSGAPHPGSGEDFDRFVAEVRDKLINGLSLGLAAMLERHEHAVDELPEPFRALDTGTADFRFVLVIGSHRDEWLPPVQDALRKAMQVTIRTWALSATAVAVVNASGARRAGLVG